MLKKKLAKDNTWGGRHQKKVSGGLDGDSDLDRGAGSGEEEEDATTCPRRSTRCTASALAA